MITLLSLSRSHGMWGGWVFEVTASKSFQSSLKKEKKKTLLMHQTTNSNLWFTIVSNMLVPPHSDSRNNSCPRWQ